MFFREKVKKRERRKLNKCLTLTEMSDGRIINRIGPKSNKHCRCSGATEEPEVVPDPAKQTDRVVKIAGISAGVLVFILLVLVAILLVKKR